MLKLLLKNRFLFLMDKLTGQKKGKKVPTAAILALITAGFIALLVGVGYLLSWLLGPLFDGFSKAGLIWLYYAITGTIALFGAFVFTFTYAQGAIYEADDNELLLSMPIRPSVMVFSRRKTAEALSKRKAISGMVSGTTASAVFSADTVSLNTGKLHRRISCRS